MPAPYETPTPGGLNLPFSLGEGLATPGRAERPREERLEQLRGLLNTAGQAITGALNSEARIAAIAKARAEARRREQVELANWVKNRKATEDNERQAAYRKGVAEREEAIKRTQFEILRDPRSENSEWVLNEAVMRQNNAQFEDEKDGWMNFILQHQEAARGDARREAERASRVANSQLVSDTRIAARTAKNAIDDIANDIQLDGELQQQLIGDGKGINERVSQHVYRVAMAAAPELFDVRKNDPMAAAKMEQQQILLDELEARAQSKIVDHLTRQHITNTNKAMEAAGNTRIEVGALSYAEGALTPEEYHDLVGDTMRTQFAHVDPKQRDSIREKLYRDQFDRLSKLLDQPNPGKALERMESLMGVADLNAGEKQIIREQIIGEKFPKAVNDRLKSLFDQKKAEMSGVTFLNEGRTLVPRDPRAVELDMLENGTYRDIAGQVLDELGINGDPRNLTPLQANLLIEIQKVTMDAEESASRHSRNANESVERAARFISGAALSAEDAGKQWSDGGIMRVLGGKLSPDDPVFQDLSSTYRKRTGRDLPWDGMSPIPTTPETMPLLKDLASTEGQLWGNNKLTPIPRALSQTIEAMVLHETPERAEIALNFWGRLSADAKQRVGQTLSARANMVLMEANRLYGHDSDGRGLSMQEITNRVRKIDENTAVAAMRLAKDQAGLHDLNPRDNFKYDYAKSLSKALERDVLEDEYGGVLSGFTPADLSGELNDLAFQLGGRDALLPLFQQMSLVQLANPEIDLDQAGVIVAARMRSQGFKVVPGTRGPRIVEDQWDHWPGDVQPDVLIKQNLATPLSAAQASAFISRLREPGPQTTAMARDGIPAADILWSYVQEREGPGSVVPHPRYWAFLPETEGEVFRNMMAQGPARERGGVPMQVNIPGIDRIQLLADTDGNPLLLASSQRRPEVPMPVNKARIPDYFLTPAGRQRFKLKPDSAEKMRNIFEIDGNYSMLGRFHM